MTERISRLASNPARSRLKVCFSHPQVPARIDTPSPNRVLPMIEPVMVALTTLVLPDRRTKSARMNSAALPKVTFNRPPMAGPARSATCSVARRIHPPRGMMAAAAAANIHIGAACSTVSAIDSGRSRQSAASESDKSLFGARRSTSRGGDEPRDLLHVVLRLRERRHAAVLLHVGGARVVAGERERHVAAIQVEQPSQVF